tara:strand:- start:4328 stop:5221 length:894 start_codon:yes stop_codon:yes gene_type:complete
MSNTKLIWSFLRIKHWYKNVVIFLGLIFGMVLLEPQNITISILGFIALCLITSSGYIRNDILDLENDKSHPEKKNRPLPSGRITSKQANIIFVGIFSIGLILSFSLDLVFGALMIILFINTEIYSRFTKRIVFLDTFAIGINFVLRAVSGIVLINTAISPWIVLGVFFVALFLAFLKRKSEKMTLGDSADIHRRVLKYYKKNVLEISVYVSGLMIIITYITYSIIGHFLDGRLIFSIPFIIAAVLRLFQLSRINHPLIEKNEFYKDKIFLGILIGYSIITLILLYSETYTIFIDNLL